jgi:hypothetical protein
MTDQDYKLKLAVGIIGVFVSLFAGWCAWHLVLRGTNNGEDVAFYFVLAGLVTGALFLKWVWNPLEQVLHELERRRER